VVVPPGRELENDEAVRKGVKREREVRGRRGGKGRERGKGKGEGRKERRKGEGDEEREGKGCPVFLDNNVGNPIYSRLSLAIVNEEKSPGSRS